MQVSRRITDKLLSLISHFPVTGIIGPRQVGKTTLARQLMAHIPRQSIYLDLELAADLNKLSQAQLFLERNTEECVVLDEIQRQPSLFPLIRALVDKQRHAGRFLILCSVSPHLIQ